MTSQPAHRQTRQRAPEPTADFEALSVWRQQALLALQDAQDATVAAVRWRVVAENAPTTSKIGLKANDEWAKAARRAHAGYAKVRKALGYVPDEDAAQPARHWDAGA